MAMQSLHLIQTPDYQKIKLNFLSEIVLASEGKPSSISFIKHSLPKKPLITQGIIQGIVIGGTNYILQTEELKSNGTRNVIDRKTGILPTFDSKLRFMNFLNTHLDKRADAIGINFGFPLQLAIGSYGEIDGKLFRATKEHTFTGIKHPVGELVKTIFRKNNLKIPFVSVANDTICLALAGDGFEKGSLVAGTGFNMSLLKIEKNKKVYINLESGNFNKFILSPILQKIDAESESPGEQLIEKAISGKYLALYFNEKVRELGLPISPIKTSQDISELSHSNHTNVDGDLARAIITRSAYLVAAAIAGMYEFSIPSQSISHGSSFELIGEGSLLWDGWHYYENIINELSKLGISHKAITIKHIKDSSINGAIGLITK